MTAIAIGRFTRVAAGACRRRIRQRAGGGTGALPVRGDVQAGRARPLLPVRVHLVECGRPSPPTTACS
jgi:hypothetical protein